MSLMNHFPSLLSRLSSFVIAPKPGQLLPVIGCSVLGSSQPAKCWHVPRQSVHTSAVVERARRGTRLRREAIKKANKKKKIEEEIKQGWIPFNQRKKAKGATEDALPDYRWKPWPPQDDVYVRAEFRWPEHTVPEAVAQLRSTHQPTIYNCPDAQVLLSLNLTLTTAKANRFIDNVSGIVLLPHPFETGQSRSVAVLTDCPDTRAEVREMGVQLVGGKEMVKLVLEGEVDLMSYDYIVASLDILPDLVPIRGFLKKKFPNPKYGTASSDVVAATHKFMTGLIYECVKPLNVRGYGNIIVPFGTLSMEDEQLTANAVALLRDVDSHRTSHKSSNLIDFAYAKCHATSELFVLDHYTYLGSKRPDGDVGPEGKDKEPTDDVAQASN